MPLAEFIAEEEDAERRWNARHRGSSEPLWWLTKDGDRQALRMYERHYSAHVYADGRVRKLFCGPGEKIVLRTWGCDALFVWRKFIDRCVDERTGEPQSGVNCAVFRNESEHQSSELIRQADAIADFCWPGERHYTYVNPQKLPRSTNPGYCFKLAGWKRCGETKGGILVLERTRHRGIIATSTTPAVEPPHDEPGRPEPARQGTVDVMGEWERSLAGRG